MLDFILNHIDSIASTVTVLSGTAAMFGYMMHRIHKDFDPKFESIENRLKAVEAEQMKFHTRLTWLDGYISGHEPDGRKRK